MSKVRVAGCETCKGGWDEAKDSLAKSVWFRLMIRTVRAIVVCPYMAVVVLASAAGEPSMSCSLLRVESREWVCASY